MAKKKTSPQPSVFISYAHEDEAWKDRLEVHCATLKRQGLLSVWDDRRIRTGSDWSQQIREAAERAKVAVLLISADFLASDFIINEEIPLLLERRDAASLEIFPLLIKPCGWQHVDWLARMNLRPRDGRPVATGTEAEIESDLVDFASELAQVFAQQGGALESGPVSSKGSHARAAAAPASHGIKPGLHPAQVEVGSRLGSFEILQALGAGGMGEVFVARDANLKRQVALKVLRPEMAADPERLQRFQREAETVAALNHPNIVTLFSIEEDRGIRFLTMELVEGKTLAEVIPARGLPLDRVYEIAGPLIEALASAHNRGVVHRDLKANNVMVSKAGQVKVLDFGLAKLLEEDGPGASGGTKITQDGLAVGTFPYMSPEQLEGKTVDARSDVFSLGVLLFEMVTGRMPFESKSATGLVASILRDAPKSIGELRSRLPVSLNGIIQRCLEKNPDERYQSALDVQKALQRSQADELEKTLLPGSVKATAEPTQRMVEPVPTAKARASKTPLVAGGVAAAVLLIAAVFWFMGRVPGSEAAGAVDEAAGAGIPQMQPPADPAARGSEVASQPDTEVPSAAPRTREPERQAPVAEAPPVAPRSPRTAAENPPPAAAAQEPAQRPVAAIPEPSPTEPAAPQAAPAEPPATSQPARQPEPLLPAPDPKKAILETLEKFARAWESLDAGNVLKVWPTGPGDKLAASFSQMKSLEMEISGCQIRLSGEDRATASCTERQSIVSKRGSPLPANERPVEFELRRGDYGWRVEDRR